MQKPPLLNKNTTSATLLSAARAASERKHANNKHRNRGLVLVCAFTVLLSACFFFVYTFADRGLSSKHLKHRRRAEPSMQLDIEASMRAALGEVYEEPHPLQFIDSFQRFQHFFILEQKDRHRHGRNHSPMDCTDIRCMMDADFEERRRQNASHEKSHLQVRALCEPYSPRFPLHLLRRNSVCIANAMTLVATRIGPSSSGNDLDESSRSCSLKERQANRDILDAIGGNRSGLQTCTRQVVDAATKFFLSSSALQQRRVEVERDALMLTRQVFLGNSDSLSAESKRQHGQIQEQLFLSSSNNSDNQSSTKTINIALAVVHQKQNHSSLINEMRPQIWTFLKFAKPRRDELHVLCGTEAAVALWARVSDNLRRYVYHKRLKKLSSSSSGGGGGGTTVDDLVAEIRIISHRGWPLAAGRGHHHLGLVGFYISTFLRDDRASSSSAVGTIMILDRASLIFQDNPFDRLEADVNPREVARRYFFSSSSSPPPASSSSSVASEFLFTTADQRSLFSSASREPQIWLRRFLGWRGAHGMMAYGGTDHYTLSEAESHSSEGQGDAAWSPRAFPNGSPVPVLLGDGGGAWGGSLFAMREFMSRIVVPLLECDSQRGLGGERQHVSQALMQTAWLFVLPASGFPFSLLVTDPLTGPFSSSVVGPAWPRLRRRRQHESTPSVFPVDPVLNCVGNVFAVVMMAPGEAEGQELLRRAEIVEKLGAAIAGEV